MVTNVKIAVGSDHAGFELKQNIIEHLSERNMNYVDFGTSCLDSVDYPDYAKKVAEEVNSKDLIMGILVCGSGQGMAMSANKHKGIRAALCNSREMTELARAHNDANILTLGARFIDESLAFSCVDTFISTSFEGDRHIQRVNKIG